VVILANYFDFFLRPTRFFEQCSLGQRPESEKNSLWESLCISWIFFICHTVYSIFFLVLGQKYVTSDFAFGLNGIDFNIDQLKMFRADIGSSLFAVVSFPLFVFYATKFWNYSVRLSAKIFERPDITSDRVDEIIVPALSSHVFYIIPFLGGFLKNIWYAYILYRGLTVELRFTRVQTIFTLALPLALLCFLSVVLSAILYLQFQTLIQMIPSFWAAS